MYRKLHITACRNPSDFFTKCNIQLYSSGLHPDIWSKPTALLAVLGAATGAQNRDATLSMTSPFSGGWFRSTHHLAFHKAMPAQQLSV